MRHQMRLQLSHEIHHHNDDDEQGRSTKVEWNVPLKLQQIRKQGDRCNVKRAYQRQSCQHTIDIVCCLLPGTNPRNKCT